MIVHPEYKNRDGSLIDFVDGPVPVYTPLDFCEKWAENISQGMSLAWTYPNGDPRNLPVITPYPREPWHFVPENVTQTWSDKIYGWLLKPEGNRSNTFVYMLGCVAYWGKRTIDGNNPNIYQAILAVNPSIEPDFGPLFDYLFSKIPTF